MLWISNINYYCNYVYVQLKFLPVNRLEEKECYFWSTDILPKYFSPLQLRPLLSRYAKKKRYTSTYKSQHFFCYKFFLDRAPLASTYVFDRRDEKHCLFAKNKCTNVFMSLAQNLPSKECTTQFRKKS